MNEITLAPKVNGMYLTNPTKTGARRMQLQSKRDFVANAKNNGLTTADAQRAFDKYRMETLSEFNNQLGQAFARGDIRADRIGSNSNGELTTIGLVRRTRTQRDRVQQAKEAYFASLSPTARAAIEQAEKIALAAEKAANSSTNTTDIEASEVQEQAAQPANSQAEGRPAVAA